MQHQLQELAAARSADNANAAPDSSRSYEDSLTLPAADFTDDQHKEAEAPLEGASSSC